MKREVKKPDGLLVDGEGRLRTARLKGIERLPTIILDGPLTQTELRLAQGQIAMHGAGLMAWDANHRVFRELAEHLDIDPAVMTKIISTLRTISDLWEALKAGKLRPSHIYEFGQLVDDNGHEIEMKRVEATVPGRITARCVGCAPCVGCAGCPSDAALFKKE
ncbi:MAG TPA: ParB/RepB/Spo0J family partition protein [Pirellulales bacterium]|nr:ParB/RepB/Spo0J family partition protein [Pirellulales bacterium]